MRILITGGTGMVGHNLRENPDFGAYEVVAPPLEELDLLDSDQVSRYIEKIKPDLIVHAAGLVGGIMANIKMPVRFFVDNLEMGKNIVMSARAAGVKRLINLGSSCMYPRNVATPLTEDMILHGGELEPTNEGYALAKIGVARLCDYIMKESPEYKYVTLIPCNLYGRWDKFDPENAHMIPAAIHKIHRAKTEGLADVLIWGDGTARREFMYAGDLADCIAHTVRNFEAAPLAMNVGLGYDFSITEYYQKAAEVIGYDGTFCYDTGKPSGMARKLVSIARQSDFGWQAKTRLEEGLKLTYEFYLNIVDSKKVM